MTAAIVTSRPPTSARPVGRLRLFPPAAGARRTFPLLCATAVVDDTESVPVHRPSPLCRPPDGLVSSACGHPAG